MIAEHTGLSCAFDGTRACRDGQAVIQIGGILHWVYAFCQARFPLLAAWHQLWNMCLGHPEPFPLGLMVCVAVETCQVWSYMHEGNALERFPIELTVCLAGQTCQV